MKYEIFLLKWEVVDVEGNSSCANRNYGKFCATYILHKKVDYYSTY